MRGLWLDVMISLFCTSSLISFQNQAIIILHWLHEKSDQASFGMVILFSKVLKLLNIIINLGEQIYSTL